jgi:hypothetical protein
MAQSDYGYRPRQWEPVGTGIYRPRWRVPESKQRTVAAPAASAAAPASDYTGYPSSGDDMLDYIRNQAMANAGARTRGLRFAGQIAGGNDPSLAAYGGLAGLLTGQGEAARDVNAGSLGYLSQQKQFAQQEKMARLYHQWQMEQQRSANAAGLWGTLGSVGGGALGGWLGPGGWWG